MKLAALALTLGAILGAIFARLTASDRDWRETRHLLRAFFRGTEPHYWNEPEDGVQPWDPHLRSLIDPKQGGPKW